MGAVTAIGSGLVLPGLPWLTGRATLYLVLCVTLVSGVSYVHLLGREDHRLDVDRKPVTEPVGDYVLSDISIRHEFRLNPFSDYKDGPPGIGWGRIDRPLRLKSNWYRQAYIFVRWTHVSDLRGKSGIVNIAVRPPGQADVTDEWEFKGDQPWIKRAVSNGLPLTSYISAVDVLYGSDAADPRPGWSMIQQPLRVATGLTDYEPHITFRRGSHQPASDGMRLRVREDGSFKIMQISDLHLSTGVGRCLDPYPSPFTGECEADPKTFAFLDRVIASEKPDLIVLSGDQLDGEHTPDARSALLKLADNLVKHKIPYATVFGNHDDEGDLTRSQLMDLLQDLPYSISQAGPSSLPGVGNYFVEVAGRSSDIPALRLYLLDSGGYSTDPKYPGYGWITPDQINWFRDLKQSHQQRDGEMAGRSNRPLNLAFIHIPLPEYYRVSKQDFIGSKGEGVSSATYNSGFYQALVETGIDAVSCGHDHLNDYCGTLEATSPELGASDKGPYLCFAGGAGFGGYGGRGYVRRVRLFEIDSGKRKLKTWKRLEWGDTESRLDEQDITRYV